MRKLFDIMDENHNVASHFAIMRMRLNGLSNCSIDAISHRASEMFEDIQTRLLTPFEYLKKYWDESMELKEQYWANRLKNKSL